MTNEIDQPPPLGADCDQRNAEERNDLIDHFHPKDPVDRAEEEFKDVVHKPIVAQHIRRVNTFDTSIFGSFAPILSDAEAPAHERSEHPWSLHSK